MLRFRNVTRPAVLRKQDHKKGCDEHIQDHFACYATPKGGEPTKIPESILDNDLHHILLLIFFSCYPVAFMCFPDARLRLFRTIIRGIPDSTIQTPNNAPFPV